MAVTVFFIAPDITLLDLARNGPKAETTQISDLKSKRAQVLTLITLDIVPMRDALSQFEVSHGASTYALAGAYTSEFIPSIYPSFSDLAAGIKNFVKSIAKSSIDRPITISLPTIYGPYISGTMPSSQWETFSDALSKLSMPIDPEELKKLSAYGKEYQALNENIEHMEKVNNEIQEDLIHREASRIEGVKSDSDQAVAGGRLRLIQTSVTRFGTLAVIVFLVSIISGLYRYTVKLAAFYVAQADALMILGSNTTSKELSAFSMILTPRVDFGKEPTTPTEQVIQLADAASKLIKKGD